MIQQIICKQILENLLSLRFIISVSLTILLFVISGFVCVSKYHQEVEDYWRETNKNLSAMNEHCNHLYKIALYNQAVWRKPSPLAFCADGFERTLPNRFKFNMCGIEYPRVKNRNNFMLPHFSYVDWSFIISVILSFVAVVLTYDTICGERQQGTLRLILAGSVARYKILLGKYAGAMFTLVVPLFLGLLINLIIVISHNAVVIGSSEWLRIIIIVFLSCLYLSLFVLLGLFISSKTSSSAVSMVNVLLVWVVLVILIPSLGRIVANTFHKIPSPARWEKIRIEAEEEVWRNAIAEKYGKHAASYSPNPNSSGANPPGRARYRNAMIDSQNRIIDKHINQMIAQANSGRNFTRVSPAVIYQRVSETIAGTGIVRSADLYQQIKQYQQDLKECIRSKDAEDPQSLHLLLDEERTIKDWVAISHKPVDFDTVPKFQERDLALGQSLKLAIWDIGLLVLFNLVFFAASFVSFLKYDVR